MTWFLSRNKSLHGTLREELNDQRQRGRPRVAEKLNYIRMVQRRHHPYFFLEEDLVVGLRVGEQDLQGYRRMPPLGRHNNPERTSSQLDT